MRNEIQRENGIVSKGIISEVFQSIKRASDISLFPLGAAYVPILLSEVEQEHRPSGNGEAGTGEGERAYIEYAPH